ncbi:PDZ domain-containing protein [Mariniblastus sp.]|nr:PDZ domain-containing protein [Mariniblastus sp.]
MRTQITTAIAMLMTVAGMITSAQAQSQTQSLPAQVIQPAEVQAPVQQSTQAYVAPGFSPPMARPPQNQFYFGVNVQLIRGYHGNALLRITSVTPGSPAAAAGLEIGDEIESINGRTFERARDSFHAVSIMNRSVNFGSPAVPAAAGAHAYIIPRPVPSQPIAQLTVRNVRNGQYVSLTMYPQQRGWSGPVPTAAAATVTSAPSVSTPAPTAPSGPVYSVPTPVANYEGYQALVQ